MNFSKYGFTLHEAVTIWAMIIVSLLIFVGGLVLELVTTSV